MVDEKNVVMDDEFCLLVDCIDCLVKLKICDDVVRDKELLNVFYFKGNFFLDLYRIDLEIV